MSLGSSINEQLARRLSREYPLEAARIFEGISANEAATILSEWDTAVVASVLATMSVNAASACLPLWPIEKTDQLISGLTPGTSSRLLRNLQSEERTAVLTACKDETAAPIRRLLRYPEDSAGALMEPNTLSLPGDITVAAARSHLVKSRNIVTNHLYITNREGGLTGVMSITHLFRASSSSTLDLVKTMPVIKIPAHANRSVIIANPGWKHHHSLPVVGHDDTLLGVISYRTLREIEKKPETYDGNSSLVLAVGEMYWNVMVHFIEGLVNIFQSKHEKPQSE